MNSKPLKPSLPTSSIVVSIGLATGAFLCTAISLAGWIIPVEVVQNRAVERVPDTDVYVRFEVFGRIEAIWWLFAYAGPLLSVASIRSWMKRDRIVEGVRQSIAEVRAMLVDAAPKSWMGSLTGWIKCVLFGAAFVLAVSHLFGGAWDRIKDWPYYRLDDGNEVLPNISESNREVIRYLRTATPEDSRIFVASDQKLFFLSYYLYPRKIYHRIHPDAEHLIPRANQARQLAAYRLDELPPGVLNDANPDYVLEYFEGKDYVIPERNAADVAWILFERRRLNDPSYIPSYTVVLRRYEESFSP